MTEGNMSSLLVSDKQSKFCHLIDVNVSATLFENQYESTVSTYF